jgi:acetyl esterase
MPAVDPKVFLPSAIAPSTAALNAEIVAKLSSLPDLWAIPPAIARENRRKGLGPFPLPPESPHARVLVVDGPRGEIPLRIIAPPGPSGVYLHLHGGGWMLGEARLNDAVLDRLAEACGLATVSVDYRLAPEYPYPAGPDDCEAAALWLVRESERAFGTARLLIGGESAGANLAVTTLVRLRDRHGLTPFRGANLIAGCFDLGMTPSCRRWGQRRLVLDTRDVRLFVRTYLADSRDPREPDISPLYADLDGLPPAHFSVGTMDPLLDDSLFMAARWEAAGRVARLSVWPGGVHVFQGFDLPMAHEAFATEAAFLNAL